MTLDIRSPMGKLFLIIGALLMVYGALAGGQLPADGVDFNLNVAWGGVLCVFGAAMQILAARARPEQGTR